MVYLPPLPSSPLLLVESDISVDLIEESESDDDPQEEDTDMDLDPELGNALGYEVVTPPNAATGAADQSC